MACQILTMCLINIFEVFLIYYVSINIYTGINPIHGLIICSFVAQKNNLFIKKYHKRFSLRFNENKNNRH